MVQGYNYNIIALDYRAVTQQLYSCAYLQYSGVADRLVNATYDLVAAGVDESSIIYYGFSLGAQIVGKSARQLNFQIKKIIGTFECFSSMIWTLSYSPGQKDCTGNDFHDSTSFLHRCGNLFLYIISE